MFVISLICYWSLVLNCVHYLSYYFLFHFNFVNNNGSFRVCEEEWFISGLFFVDMELPKHLYGERLEFLPDAGVGRELWYMFLKQMQDWVTCNQLFRYVFSHSFQNFLILIDSLTCFFIIIDFILFNSFSTLVSRFLFRTKRNTIYFIG